MVKSLLLGSAAGVAAVAVAQAADLPVKAAPVQYVRICTLYGDGFYYIPGSDTCIKFQGYIRIDYGWNGTAAATPNHYTGAAGAQDRTVSRHSTRHRGSFAVDTRTQTSYGTLRTYQQLHVSNENEGTVAVIISRAFIQWGGFTFGHTVSFTDHEGSVGDAGLRSVYATQNDSTSGANGTNQIAYTWQLGNGITFNVGADERRVKSMANWGISTTSIGTDPTTFRHGNTNPNPWVSLRVSQAWGAASIAVIANHNQATYYSQNIPPACTQTGTTHCGYPDDEWGWAVISGAEVKLDFLSPGSRIGGYFNYGVGATAYTAALLASPGLFGSGNRVAWGVVTDAVYINGSQQELTTAWTVGGGFEYFWTRNFSSTIYGTYTEISYNSTVVNNRWFCGGVAGSSAQNIVLSAATACDPSFKFWTVGTHHDWYPVPGLRFVVDVLHTGIETATDGATITLAKAQGARPTGNYTARNLGITSVVFRAIRAWGG
jgi:hypothetical protein